MLIHGAYKKIKFSNEDRASILKGVNVLANAVSVTLGSKGKKPLDKFFFLNIINVVLFTNTHAS